MKKVSRAEFEQFIKDYPEKLHKSGCNDIGIYNDFTLGDLSVSAVAKVNMNLYEGGVTEYYIKN